MWGMRVAGVIAGLLAAVAPATAPAASTAEPAPVEPLSLARAEALALRYQPSVRQAAGETEAASGRVEEARSGYLPQINGTAIYERTTGNFAPRPGALPQTVVNGMVTTPASQAVSWGANINYWSFGVTGSQLVYDFNATLDRWRSASAAREAAQATGRGVELQALFAVRRAYFQARAQRDLAAVAQEAVTNQQRHVDQITEMVRAGLRSQIDLATTRTSLANARVQMISAQNNFGTAQATLSQTMGLPGDLAFELTDDAMPPIPGEEGAARALIDRALAARPEVAAADRQRRAQELLVGAARGGYGPALSVTGSLTDVGTSLSNLTPNWFVGLQASWALLAGGLTHGQVREAKGTLTAVAAQADATRLQVTVDVEQARLAVRAAKATIEGAREALVNARAQLRLAEGRYETGQGSVIELDDAQVAYTTAQAQEVSARFGLSTARAQLLAALGAHP
jgi:outer membrane protein